MGVISCPTESHIALCRPRIIFGEQLSVTKSHRSPLVQTQLVRFYVVEQWDQNSNPQCDTGLWSQRIFYFFFCICQCGSCDKAGQQPDLSPQEMSGFKSIPPSLHTRSHPPFPLLLSEKDCTVSNCANIPDADRKQAIRGYWWLSTKRRERWKKLSFSLYCTSVWDSSYIFVLSTRRFTASNLNRLNEHDFINIFLSSKNSRNVKYVCTFSEVVSLGGN